MSESRNLKLLFKSLPTATSPDARWGMAGLVAGFVLFAIPLALYFFEKGGVLMLLSWVWITLGIIVSIIWLAAAFVFFRVFWGWWKTTNNTKAITATQIIELIEANLQLINEIRQERDERNKDTKQ